MAQDILYPIVALIGASTGIAGLIISSVTLNREIQKDKVRLVVVPNWSLFVPATGQGSEYFASIEVINLSGFPVTVSSVTHKSKDGKYANHTEFLQPAIGTVRLEPRESEKWILFNNPEFIPHLKSGYFNKVVVSTSCGTTIEKRISKRLRESYKNILPEQSMFP